MEELDGDQCYPSVKELPVIVNGVFICVSSLQTAQVLRECAELGIRHIWMQQGAESQEAIRFCEENGFSPVHGEGLLMFSEPVKSFHKFHRWLRKIFGKLPK